MLRRSPLNKIKDFCIIKIKKTKAPGVESGLRDVSAPQTEAWVWEKEASVSKRTTISLMVMMGGLGVFVPEGLSATERVHCRYVLTTKKEQELKTLLEHRAPTGHIEYKRAHEKTRFGEGMVGGPKYMYVRYENEPLEKILSDHEYNQTHDVLKDIGILEMEEPEFVMQLQPGTQGGFDGILTWANVQRNVEFFETDACERTITIITNFEKLSEVNDLVPGIMVKKGYVKYTPSEDPLVKPSQEHEDRNFLSHKKHTKRPHLVGRITRWIKNL